MVIVINSRIAQFTEARWGTYTCMDVICSFEGELYC